MTASPRVPRAVAALVTAACLLVLPARAATLAVTVRDTSGLAVEGAHVSVRPREGVSPRFAPPGAQAYTDLMGVARITVDPGRWLVGARSPRDLFVASQENPRLPPVFVDVGRPGDVVAVEIVVESSGFVRVRAESNDEVPAMEVEFLGLDSPQQSALRLSEDATAGAKGLLPGRWRVRPVVPPGWLLTGLMVDGWPLPGADAVVEVVAGEAHDVVVTVEGMAGAGGRLGIAIPGATCPGDVTAVLVEPGPWLAAAEARGGSTFRVVPAAKDPRSCTWSVTLPSGRWRLDVACGDGCVVEPASPEIELDPGEQQWIDFNGTGNASSGGGGARRDLVVVVNDPQGKPLRGALVEAWPDDASSVDATPLARDRTGPYGHARLAVKRGPGAFRVVAGHEDHLDAAAEPAGDAPAPSAGADEAPVVTLRPAARLDVRAVDREGRSVPGVDVRLRAAFEPDDLLADPLMRKYRRGRRRLADAEGRVAWSGLHGGDYEVAARVTGADSESFLVELVAKGLVTGPRLDEGRLNLVEGETAELEVRINPAARIAATLDPQCDDVPIEIDVRAVDAVLAREGDEDVDRLVDQAALRMPRVPRAGAGQLQIEAGPLPTGAWILAVKPAGFDRWTLSPGVEVLADAEGVEAVEGKLARVESLAIDCSPLLELVPVIASGAEPPDLREASAAVTWTARGVPDAKPRTLVARNLRTRVRVEAVPLGAGDLALSVTHPHALPEPTLELRKQADLRAGGRLRVLVEWADVGGALRVSSGAPFAGARPIAADAPWRRVVPVVEGRALVPSLEPGAWIVGDCEDAACAQVTRERRAVVEAGRTLAVE